MVHWTALQHDGPDHLVLWLIRSGAKSWRSKFPRASMRGTTSKLPSLARRPPMADASWCNLMQARARFWCGPVRVCKWCDGVLSAAASTTRVAALTPLDCRRCRKLRRQQTLCTQLCHAQQDASSKRSFDLSPIRLAQQRHTRQQHVMHNEGFSMAGHAARTWS